MSIGRAPLPGDAGAIRPPNRRRGRDTVAHPSGRPRRRVENGRNARDTNNSPQRSRATPARPGRRAARRGGRGAANGTPCGRLPDTGSESGIVGRFNPRLIPSRRYGRSPTAPTVPIVTTGPAPDAEGGAADAGGGRRTGEPPGSQRRSNCFIVPPSSFRHRPQRGRAPCVSKAPRRMSPPTT
ncbi:hypothetical protein A33M_0652 [Rhodovulum sp. PH10]|nr:hypothetical protein A33M_0652 [Rhodovulum sp. PH10]